jgi:hypothetical protein
MMLWPWEAAVGGLSRPNVVFHIDREYVIQLAEQYFGHDLLLTALEEHLGVFACDPPPPAGSILVVVSTREVWQRYEDVRSALPESHREMVRLALPFQEGA